MLELEKLVLAILYFSSSPALFMVARLRLWKANLEQALSRIAVR